MSLTCYEEIGCVGSVYEDARRKPVPWNFGLTGCRSYTDVIFYVRMQVSVHSGARGKAVSGGLHVQMSYDVISANTPATSRSHVALAAELSLALITSHCTSSVTITSRPPPPRPAATDNLHTHLDVTSYLPLPVPVPVPAPLPASCLQSASHISTQHDTVHCPVQMR